MQTSLKIFCADTISANSLVMRESAPELPTPIIRSKPPPAHVAKLIKKRTGYANYYFNEQNQQRVWSALLGGHDFQDVRGTWILTGKVTGGGPFEITLGEQQVTSQFPASRDTVDVRLDLDQQLGPEGSGGLLAALHVWQRMLLLGPSQFGETYYLGTAPLIDHKGLFDVLVGTYNVIEARFACDPRNGHLVAVELFPETHVDPCEVYFSDYRQQAGHSLPHRILVRHGDQVFIELEVEKYTLKVEK